MEIRAGKMMLAYICNDVENVEDYEICDEKCYYKNKYIGRLKSEFNEDEQVLEVFYYPIMPVEFIDIKITVTPTVVDFN